MPRQPGRQVRKYCTEWQGGKTCVKIRQRSQSYFWELHSPSMSRSFKFIRYGGPAAALKAAEETLYKEQLSRCQIKNRYRFWYGGQIVEMQTSLKADRARGVPPKPGKTFFFDAGDLEKVIAGPTWSFKEGYVAAHVTGRSKLLLLHRYLLDYDGELEVDHHDRNPSNNSRENIDICTRVENNNNKSLYKNNKTGENGISKGFSHGKPKFVFRWYEEGKPRSQYFERTDAGWDEAVKEKKKKYKEIDNKNGN